ncbi:MAG: hypothetical protein WA728_30105 [Xanthobacteraceae bacterium]
MRTFIRCATSALALVAGVPVAKAQSPVTQQPYEAFIVQPSGTLVTQMPFVTLPEGVIREVQTVQTNQPEHVAPPIARRETVANHHVIVHHVAAAASKHVAQPIAPHRVVASHQVIVHHVASSQPLYDYVAIVPVVNRIVTPVVITPPPALAPGQVLNVSGQFQCVEGCAGGLPGAAFVTQNGRDLNLVNELGQPTRAWIDWQGHIWAQNWNEGAVYSPDGMTIQFDNGTVWRRNIALFVLRPNPSGR